MPRPNKERTTPDLSLGSVLSRLGLDSDAAEFRAAIGADGGAVVAEIASAMGIESHLGTRALARMLQVPDAKAVASAHARARTAIVQTVVTEIVPRYLDELAKPSPNGVLLAHYWRLIEGAGLVGDLAAPPGDPDAPSRSIAQDAERAALSPEELKKRLLERVAKKDEEPEA